MSKTDRSQHTGDGRVRVKDPITGKIAYVLAAELKDEAVTAPSSSTVPAAAAPSSAAPPTKKGFIEDDDIEAL